MTNPMEFVVEIAQTLERLGIAYHVGGSVASSAHGTFRASADVDFVIDASSEQLEALAQALESEFYVSRHAIAEAAETYLDHWAAELGVADLLACARHESRGA